MSELGVQVPLVMVQTNRLSPVLSPFTAVLGLVADTKVAVPEMTVHVPEPADGVLPLRVVVVAQIL